MQLSLVTATLLTLPGCTIDPRRLTTQEACGVEIGKGVSKDQAFCIARSLGLSEGLEPWGTNIEPAQPGEKSSRWVVFNREVAEACPPDGIIGQAVVIDMRDGRVLASYPNSVICCPGFSRP